MKYVERVVKNAWNTNPPKTDLSGKIPTGEMPRWDKEVAKSTGISANTVTKTRSDLGLVKCKRVRKYEETKQRNDAFRGMVVDAKQQKSIAVLEARMNKLERLAGANKSSIDAVARNYQSLGKSLNVQRKVSDSIIDRIDRKEITDKRFEQLVTIAFAGLVAAGLLTVVAGLLAVMGAI